MVCIAFPVERVWPLHCRACTRRKGAVDGMISRRSFPTSRVRLCRAAKRNGLLLILVCAASTASTAARYVDLNNTSPQAPFTTWSSAATDIQTAVDAADIGDEVIVTNGVYQTGAHLSRGVTNRVTVTNAMTIRSVNGPAVTFIVGVGPIGPLAVRCVAITTNDVLLAGFTLTNGATHGHFDTGGGAVREYGGGALLESPSAVLSNCVLTGNSANVYGGGAFDGTLNNCTITDNSAGNSGGGATYSHLNNCTVSGNSALNGGGTSYATLHNCKLTGNSARVGGGAMFSTLVNCTLVGNSATNSGGGVTQCNAYNCILYYNTAPNGPDRDTAPLYNCCSTSVNPQAGNFTSAPLFVDTNGWRNLRLQADSPCINSGDNLSGPGATDLDGRPRIVSDIVDVGAYEFQPGANGAFIGWLESYGLATDGSVDAADSDGDGLNNWNEWGAGTDPTNTGSVLRVLSATQTVSGVTVTWSSVTNRSYALEAAVDLGDPTSFSVIQSNIVGSAVTSSVTDTNATSSVARFYRVRAEN